MGLYRRKVRHRDGSIGESRCWWGSYYDHRTRRTERASTKCSDRKAAAAVLRRWERRSADPEDRPKDSAPLRARIAVFLESKRSLVKLGKRSMATVDMHEEKSAHLARVLGDETPVRAIDAAAVDHFIKTRVDDGAAANTIAKELTTLRGVLKLSHRHGKCDHPSAVMPLDYSAEYVPRERFLGSALELDVLIEQLEEGRGAHVKFIVATSAREGEAKNARPGDVDLDAGFVKLRGTKTDKSARLVPIVGFSRKLLEEVLREAPGEKLLFRPWGNIRRDLHEACRRAHIDHVSPNDLRRTYSKWLRARGVEPQLIGEAMGHVDSRMVERVYGKLPPETLSDLLRQRVGDGHADARRLGGRVGSMGRLGCANARGIVDVRVPRGGIEPSTRGFSNPVLIDRNRPENRLDLPPGAPGDLSMYVGPTPETIGELLDEALSLGATGTEGKVVALKLGIGRAGGAL